MKVLIDGRATRRFAKINCKYCESVLEVTKEDIKRAELDRDGHAFVFDCAICQCEIWVAVTVVQNIA